ncbi:glycoside hydrolase family 97 N-terminal domain-containing protein [Clostridiaceae bacterium NSJ-31]|uniref:Glycoside hydrolase family 97 N-terminal domain-containing protein n=1 Tax=Ligaoa zhengdingensis TaxID=2763658 RepID=A0A926DZ32_9FIRM|nr:glycoside hydrolase family 97 N-terminal domain-containing protein [Ligaoa zhengdingensis]MBC8546731.1 glycoside hydrolase family 97 N-terminal domain-containing protein [Ligaoa zhengdingensis]
MKKQMFKAILAAILAMQLALSGSIAAMAEGIETEPPVELSAVEPSESPAVPEEPAVPDGELKEEDPAEIAEAQAPVLLAASVPEGAEKIPQDTLTVSSTNGREDYPDTNAVDGNPNTLWHTAGGANPPHDFFIDMGSEQAVSLIEITGRKGSGNSLNGFPAKIEVYASEDGEIYEELVGQVNWTGTTLSSGMVKTIELDNAVTTRYLKLHITDTIINSSPYKPAAIAELNLYYIEPFTQLETLIEDAEKLLDRVTAEEDRAALQAAIDAAAEFVAADNPTEIDAELEKLQAVMDEIAEKLIVRYDVSSPDGSLTATFWLDAKGTPRYQVVRGDETLVGESSMGVTLVEENGGALTSELSLLSVDTAEVDTSWTPAVKWTRDEIPDVYTQSVFHLGDEAGRRMDIIFRAYDEGFGFRYFFPEEDNALTDFTIYQENSTFAIPAGTRAHAHGTHSQSIPNDVMIEKLIGTHYVPIVLEYESGSKAGMFESDLYDYARLKLDANGGVLSSNVRWGSANITASVPFESPWRGMIVADSLGGLQENNYLVQNLADEQKIQDMSWIKTGQLIREAKLTEENTKECIDFAAENGIEYILYDSGWYGTENDPAMNPMEPFIGEFPYMLGGSSMRSCYVDVRDAAKWAAEKDIGVILYVNHIHLEEYDLDEVFRTYKEWGIKGVKFGFVNVGNQYWTKWLADAVATAAKYDLVVKIHDEYIPTGLDRAYPNLLNVEGVLGDEGSPNYAADLKQVFTRMILGPADHTFCYPMMKYRGAIKTDAYSLASPMLFYAPLSCPFWYGSPADYPDDSAYPERKFWVDMPGEWDESRHIDSSFGEYYTMARRNGEEWFLGSLSAVNRDLEFTPDFLTPGVSYVAECYTNSAGDTLSNNKVAISKYIVNSETEFLFPMIVGGGLSVRMVPATEAEISSIAPYSKHRERLGNRLKVAEQLDLSVYTTRSLRESDIVAVREAARLVYENIAAEEADVILAADNLESAMAALVEKTFYFEKIDQSLLSASASTERPGTHEAKFVLDGNPDSIWHIKGGVGVDPPPFEFWLDLGEERAVDAIEITGRRDSGSSYNGFPVVIEVYTSEDGVTYDKQVTSVNWKGMSVGAGTTRRIDLPETINSRYIELHILDAYHNNSPYVPAAIAELNLYYSPFSYLNRLVSRANDLLPRITDEAEKAAWIAAIDDAVYYAETAQNTDELAAYEQALEALVAPFAADKAILTDLLAATDGKYDGNRFTAQSWAAFAKALNNAKVVEKDIAATQQEVYSAYLELVKARDGLTYAVDTSLLELAIKLAEEVLENTGMTDKSRLELTEAVEAARAVLNNAEATQSEVNAQYKAVMTKITELVPVDKKWLGETIEAARGLQKKNYTTASWAAFVEKLAAAELVYGNNAASETQVKEALDALMKAMTELESLTVNKVALQNAVDLANELIDSGKYDEATLADLIAAVADAQRVLDDEHATQQRVDGAKVAVVTATAKVRLKKALDDAKVEKAALSKSDYTARSWKNYLSIIEKAEMVYNDMGATEEQIDLAASQLKGAADVLRRPSSSKNSVAQVSDSDYWAGVAEKISGADKGGKVNATLEGGAMMPATVIDTLKGRDVTLVVTISDKNYELNGLSELKGYSASAVYYTAEEIMAMAGGEAKTAAAEIPVNSNPETGGGIAMAVAPEAVAPAEAASANETIGGAQAAAETAVDLSAWEIVAMAVAAAAVLVGTALVLLRKRNRD